MHKAASPAFDRRTMSRVLADLVGYAAPLLRQRFGLSIEAADEAARLLGEGFCERAARQSARPERRPGAAATFIVTVLDIAEDVLREVVGVPASDAHRFASLIVESICTRLQRCTAVLPHAESLLNRKVFELPAPTEPIRSTRLGAAEFVGRLTASAGEAIQAVHPEGDPGAARHAAKELAYRVCERYGGCQVYVPLARAFALQRRNLAICAEFASPEVSP